MPKTNLAYFWGVLAVGLVIFLLSQLTDVIDQPDRWVTEWTNWLMTYVGIGVTARGLWIISDALAKRIERQ